MSALALQNKIAYEDTIKRHLCGLLTGQQAVQAFFSQYAIDNPQDARAFPTYPSDVSVAWNDLFSRLFNLHEDVVFDSREEAAGAFPISEAEFKAELSELRPLLANFGPIPNRSPD